MVTEIEYPHKKIRIPRRKGWGFECLADNSNKTFCLYDSDGNIWASCIDPQYASVIVAAMQLYVAQERSNDQIQRAR